MRLFSISMLLTLFVITHLSFGQTSSFGTKTQSNTIFVKIKDASNEYILYPNANKEMALNVELKKIIETYKIGSINPTFPITEKTDARLKRVYTLSFPVSAQKEAIMSALRKLSFVEYVEMIPMYELFLTPNDLNAQQWNLPKINAPAAWNLSTGSGKVIAIVDDAVRLTHEDLAANIWVNAGEIAGNGIDDDGNGYIDDVNGYDVADNDNNPMVPATATNSEFTHGTHCSGIAAGVSNNGKGIASIGYNNKIMAVKCKQSADVGGSLPYAYSGLAYAIETDADVISMSWGGYYYSATYQLLFDVAYNKGIVCVAAAGNSNTNVPMYPASYNHVISVAATDQNDLRASFSNYGSTIDVSAPGVDIYSTLAGSDNAYGNLSGTSMACPLVSGLCALMLSYNPLLTPDELEACLKNNTDNIDNLNPGYSGALGTGRINAYKTMLCLQKTPTAAFQSDKQLVCPGQTVTYTDKSSLGSNTGVTWSWSFPGATPSTSTIQNPTIVYNTAGTYSATLTVTNTFGNSVETKTNYITVNALTAALSGSASIPTGGNALLKVDFSNSSGPYTITYTDGTTAVTKNNITTNPYYFTVTPAATSTYTLTAVSTASCTGIFSGSAVITLGGFPSTNCSGVASSKFEKALGTSVNQTGNALITHAGEYYITGISGTAPNTDFYITKLNANWDVQWTKKHGTSSAETLYQSTKTTDGAIISCGITSANGTYDAYVVKSDLNGNVLWSKTYGGAQDEYPFNIQNTSDGGYVIAGRAESYSGNLDAYVLKIDAVGTLQWSKSFGRAGNDYIFNCYETSDGGYITAGSSQESAYENYDWIVTKLSSTGTVIWSKIMSSPRDEGARKLLITSDGGFLLVGHSRYKNNDSDAIIVKLDANGNLQWRRSFGGSGSEDTYLVSQTSDGNYIAAGYTDSFGAGGFDIFMTKFDGNGNVFWNKLYGGSAAETLSGGTLCNTADGGYAVVGTTASFGAGGTDAYLIKTDCNGDTDCKSSNVTFQEYTPTVTFFANTINMLNAPGSGNPTTLTTSSTISSTSVCIAATCMVDGDFYASDTVVCKGTTINFTSTTKYGTVFKWYIDNNLVGQNATLSHVFPTEGDYKIILVVSDANCSDTDTLIVTVKPDPKLITSNDITICKNSSINLLVSGAATYQWLNPTGLSCSTCANPTATPTGTTKYYVTGTDVNGCTSKDSVMITTRCCVLGNIPSPSAKVIPSDSIICLNEEVIFSTTYTVDGSTNPSWDFGPAATPRYSTGDVGPITVKYTQPGRWPAKLVLTDNCGKDSVLTYISVFNPPVVDAYPDVALCSPPDSIQFNITPISDYTYSWTPTTGLSDPNSANPWVKLVDVSILYTRTITDNNTGCSATDAVKVSSHTSYKIQAMNDTTINVGKEVTLKACCTDYSWTPSTYLDNPNAKNPNARPNESMWYYAHGIDSIGCVARDSVFIAVIILEPFIPNLITPNGDDSNDTFEIKNICSGSRVEIYNRWGNLVFKSEDYKNEWDGKNNSDGLYFVTFQSGCGGKLYKGWLQVLGGN